MAVRLYVLPYEANTATPGRTIRGPKSLAGAHDTDPSDNVAVTDWVGKSYGLFPWGLVAVDADAAGHAALSAQASAHLVPTSGNVTLANRDTVRSFLESVSLPGNWVTATTTWQEVYRTVGGFMQFAGRVDELAGVAEGSTPSLGERLQFNLGVQWQNIPTALQNIVVQVAQEFGYDTSPIQPTTTVRQILKALGDGWGSQPLFTLRDSTLDQIVVI